MSAFDWANGPIPVVSGFSRTNRRASVVSGFSRTSAIRSIIHNTPVTSSRLRNDVDKRWLAALDDGNGAFQRRREIGRILNRSFGEHAHPLRDFGEIDVRFVDRRAKVGAVETSIVAVRPPLHA